MKHEGGGEGGKVQEGSTRARPEQEQKGGGRSCAYYRGGGRRRSCAYQGDEACGRKAAPRRLLKFWSPDTSLHVSYLSLQAGVLRECEALDVPPEVAALAGTWWWQLYTIVAESASSIHNPVTAMGGRPWQVCGHIPRAYLLLHFDTYCLQVRGDGSGGGCTGEHLSLCICTLAHRQGGNTMLCCSSASCTFHMLCSTVQLEN
jgi:hypothetical protein